MATRRNPTVMMSRLCVALLAAGSSPAASSAESPGAPWQVREDGAVTGVLTRPDLGTQAVRFDLALPKSQPIARRLEEEHVPILVTQWEAGGVRYTQTVLMSALDEGPVETTPEVAPNAVLLVRVMGENLDTVYADASAGLAVVFDNKVADLELRDGVAHAKREGRTVALAAIDIPAEGVRSTNGLMLKFYGSMPPSLNGCMVVKIPVGRTAVSRSDAWPRLQDLEFEKELRRVRKAWKQAQQPPAGTAPASSVGFAP